MSTYEIFRSIEGQIVILAEEWREMAIQKKWVLMG